MLVLIVFVLSSLKGTQMAACEDDYCIICSDSEPDNIGQGQLILNVASTCNVMR